MLNLDQILNIDDAKFEEIEIPEWGDSVRVKAMTSGERDKYMKLISDKTHNGKVDIQNVTAKLVIMTVVNEDNKLMFNDGHLDMLNKKSAKVLERIGKVALKLAGLDAKDINEAVKN